MMTATPITQRDLERGLHQLGLRRGAVVEVHSSLSRFGSVAGGADAVVAALMAAVGPEGTIVMSAYPVSPPVPLTEEDRAAGVSWKVRRLALDSPERTGMGAVADAFRRHPEVRCGSSFFRTCAWGRDAEWHLDGYHGLLAVDGWCLLLGVGIDRCSSMHAGDSIALPEAIGRCWEIPEHVRAGYDEARWSIGYGDTPDDAWAKVWAAADQRGLIRHRQIGEAACHLFRARSVVSIYRRWRTTDPYGLYGVTPPATA
jgi:aminoglycoside 3-N-acetyltransferase